MRLIDADALMEILTTAIRNMKGMAKFLGAEDDPEIKMEIKAYTDIANGVKDMPTIEPEVDGRYFREPPQHKPKAEEPAPAQEAKADAGKERLTLVPMQIIWDIAKVREWAVANKYPDPSNWKTVEPERYREALLRHILRYVDEPDGVDEETGLPHLYHVATNCAFLCAMEEHHG